MKVFPILLLLLLIPTIALAKVSCVSGVDWSGDQKGKPDPRMSSIVTMKLDEQNKTVTIALKNNTQNDVSFVDWIRYPVDAAEFFGIKVRDDSQNEVTRGYISNYMMHMAQWSTDSGYPNLPKKLTTLHSGEALSHTIKISDMLTATQKGWKVPPEKLDKVSVRFQLRVYLDFALKRYTQCQSDWYYSKDTKLLEALDPIEQGTPHVPGRTGTPHN